MFTMLQTSFGLKKSFLEKCPLLSVVTSVPLDGTRGPGRGGVGCVGWGQRLRRPLKHGQTGELGKVSQHVIQKLPLGAVLGQGR